MPLLCENRRPEGYTGAWPVLHCCQHDWCNNEIIPTDPPWSSRNIDGRADRKFHCFLCFDKCHTPKL